MVWFRRDLRTADHPALLAAAERSGRALGLFVLDDRLLKPSGEARVRFLHQCLHALNEQLGGRLMVVHGDPAEVVPAVAREVGAASVHISADCAPYGRRRDEAVEKALGDIELVRSGSPYAVTPGRVRKADGTPFKVFTPFRTAWLAHGWRAPADTDASIVDWMEPPRGNEIPAAEPLPDAMALWERFRDERLPDYDETRDRPDLDATSRLSAFLKFGVLHPRTLLAGCDGAFRSELAWREFYADVLWHKPETARQNYDRRFDGIEHDDDLELFRAWQEGRTGFPIVDAGMRQLLAEGFMHNRVRMIVASFLVKDLHLPWWWGARHFMKHLVDGDIASNQHNWQWVAGCGTDAAPYFRIFNPATQAEKFDPDGEYVRRYVTEVVEPVVDHAVERQVALDRYRRIRS
ncbi:deoxyribodipyrimidine photo-lyase [Lentzea tibetensis]|uniref:Deoxyribodipyrimidine photo-lyase n=1 Tax=Lentzea tibetensis TaxID=2591470 RepID=A0A563ER54_9PSEU|nr:deoxyribodipyrimidine photo-lyase [Lentzea tibetensis]TWP50117.1 deoxyribodipyrimidine photo-lyase [Lentzea tibetensis]